MGDDIFRQGKSAVVCARASTKGQAESGVSIETQLKTCRSWCRQNGVEVVGEFHDDGVSGTTNDRDDFGMLIGAVVSKQPHYLVVYDSSRLTRKGPEELNRLKAVLDMYRCEAIYAGYGGLSGKSEAALHLDTYKSATDSLFVKEQTRKTRDSVDRNIAEGRHVSRAVTFAFSDDIPLMPEGRILLEPRERERKDADGRIVRSVTPATVVKSVSDFFALVDRGASIEVIAEMWGIERHALADAVNGRSRCTRESCLLPDRSEEYRRRLKDAKDSGSEDRVLLEQYRHGIRQRKTKERGQCRRKAMERGCGAMNGDNGSLVSIRGRLVSTSCRYCDYCMIGRWSPWCSKTMSPLLFVTECPLEGEGE